MIYSINNYFIEWIIIWYGACRTYFEPITSGVLFMIKKLLFVSALSIFQPGCQGGNTQEKSTEDGSSVSTFSGYENNRRKTGLNGLAGVGLSKSYKVTGRTSMGPRDRNQCEATYSGDEKVTVTYSEQGVTKTSALYITGVNNSDFATSSNGIITDACGTIVEATFISNGRSVVERFVVVDQIYESHAQNEPNLDIAKAAYFDIRKALGHSDNFTQINVKTIANGSYTYTQNSDCSFMPGVLTICGFGW